MFFSIQTAFIIQILAAGPLGAELFFQGQNADLCSRTQRGCHCKKQWAWSGNIYSGCQLPDNDPLGSWCIIDQDCDFDATDEASMVTTWEGNHTGDYWHYCGGYYCPLGSGVEPGDNCQSTVSGCQCLNDWSYIGGDGFLYSGYSGCANPDNDEQGDWCIVDPKTCSQPPPGNKEALFPKQTDQVWDHCQCKSTGIPGAKIQIVKASIPANLTQGANAEQDDAENSEGDQEVDCDPAVIPFCMRRRH
eukprot:TRINITY_DN3673_c0_g2_i1.p3 TRINITY_DN3673_c0_g2~~TRINITY_DN3673_c0_g2_i1.p3  ORF type:complete len:247 (+),score=20.21 TRINITY_DN3673_c0_g2_i1:203-943(+)